MKPTLAKLVADVLADDAAVRASATTELTRFLGLEFQTGAGKKAIRVLLQQHSHHADVFFASLLNLAENESVEHQICECLLEQFCSGRLRRQRLSRCADYLSSRFRDVMPRLRVAQRDDGIAWRWDDRYQDNRHQVSLWLDLMGYIDSEMVRDDLRIACALLDPRLVHFALLSLLRLGETVDPTRVEMVARSREMRGWLYDDLKKLEKLDLFPSEFADQSALAESNMISWLTFGTELGREPDEIEQMGVFRGEAEPDGDPVDYYVFRFRVFPPHWAASDGWQAGIAGPFPALGGPNTHGGSTFSKFEKWESKSAKQHLLDILEITG